MDAWLDRRAGRDRAKRRASPPRSSTSTRTTARELLNLARIAAHESGERINAPLLTYLAGVAVGRGADLDAVVAAATSAR